jgi:hypothetical protein
MHFDRVHFSFSLKFDIMLDIFVKKWYNLICKLHKIIISHYDVGRIVYV